MKKSRWIAPYTNKRTNAPGIKGKSGVYLIRKAGTDKILYRGFSTSDLYKTLYRHFQSWEDDNQVRVTYPKSGYQIRIILCTPKQAKNLEEALRYKYLPKENPQDLPGDFFLDSYHKIVMQREKETPVSAIDDFIPF